MFAETLQLPLIRRLIGQYLLYALAAAVTLAAGLILLIRTVHHADEHAQTTARVLETRDLILDDYVGNSGNGVLALLQQLTGEQSVTGCGVVAADAKYVAHSRSSRIGQVADVADPAWIARSGCELLCIPHTRISTMDFWAPLKSGDREFGYLHVSISAAPQQDWLHRVLDYSPPAILIPILIVLAGSRGLKRTIKQTAVIDDQLRGIVAAGSGKELRLRPLKESGPAASGWNRLIEEASKRSSGGNLEARLSEALNGVRQQRAESILNHLSEGVLVTVRSGEITFGNRAAGILLDFEENALCGKMAADVLPAAVMARADAVSPELQPLVLEFTRTADLSDGVLRFARSPVRGDDGLISAHVWSIRDITQQKMSEEARSQFVNSATHELRTPLANIKAYAETLTLAGITDVEQQKKFLNVINSEATRLARFIDELLNISQMEAGALSLERKETDLERLFTEVVEKVRPQTEQKELTFDVNLPAKYPKVKLDKDKFIAALINVLGNAIKYTLERGSVSFRVGATSKELQITIEDTGIGIRPDEIPKIFEKFFRSADPQVRDLPGSGLGLSFTQEVIRLHGGKLTVHSELSKGTQFLISIPLAGG